MLTFNGKLIPFGNFPNGESYIHADFFERHRTDRHAFDPGLNTRNVLTLKYESDEDLARLWFARASAPFPITLRITYFPYSRMDRENGEYVFMLKHVANLINSMGWEQVVIYEPHSDVTPALLDRCKTVNVIPELLKRVTISDYQLFYPDAGAQKRYSDNGERALVGLKYRNFETGKITEFNVVGKLLSEAVVIVDDLCSKGGTFILAAEKLREMGAKQIILVVAHCEKTIFQGEVLATNLIDHVITTDSILDLSDRSEKLEIFPLTYIRW